MKIIAFVGMPASGKSEASAVARSLNIPVVSMGDVVREETARQGLPPMDENIGGVGTKLREVLFLPPQYSHPSVAILAWQFLPSQHLPC
jgi:dephospho-CoA kinase